MTRNPTWRRCPTCDGYGDIGPKAKICRDCGGSGWEHK